MSESQHKYRPLESPTTIRLLSLLPPTEDGELSLKLEHSSLEDAQNSFTAISYTWGREGHLHRVWIDGTWMLLRKNIWNFVHHCINTPFKKVAPLRFWVDAICINQADLHEKSAQVRLMSKIFGLATNVLVWLGSASTQTRLLESFRLYRQNPYYPSQGEYVDWLHFSQPRTHRLDKGSCLEIIKLFGHDYWYRLW